VEDIWLLKGLVYHDHVICEDAYISDAFQHLDEKYLMHNRFYLRYKTEIKTHQYYFLRNAENKKSFTTLKCILTQY